MSAAVQETVVARPPFIEGTKQQWAWDSTSIGWLKQCPRKYQYEMIEGWQPKSRAAALIFGQLFHQALEVYEFTKIMNASQPTKHEGALKHAVNVTLTDSKDWVSEDPLRNRWTLIRSVIWYLDEFEHDAATTKVFGRRVAVEMSFESPLDYRPPNQTMPFVAYSLCGHLDRVVEFQGETWVMDHKTTKSQLGDQWFGSFDPDNQMSLYSWACAKLTGEKIRGVIVDGAQIGVGFTRFARGFTSRTQSRINEWLKDLNMLLRQNEQYVAADYWPMNDKSCRGCAFRNVCSADPSVRQRLLESDFVRQPWNPLVFRG